MIKMYSLWWDQIKQRRFRKWVLLKAKCGLYSKKSFQKITYAVVTVNVNDDEEERSTQSGQCEPEAFICQV